MIEDYSKTLREVPALISRESELAEESRFYWQNAKEDLKQAEAVKYLETKAHNDKMTVSEIQAIVNADEILYDKRMSIVCHESEYRKHQGKIDSMIEALQAAKMLCRIDLNERNANGEVYERG